MCLFIGAGFTQLSAQSDNKAISSWDEVNWFVDVYCGDVWTDVIQGYGSVHFVVKFKKGEVIWERTNSNMTATGLSGESFKYIEQDLIPHSSIIYPVLYDAELKYQLIGDQGHHYLGVLRVRVIHLGGSDVEFEFTPIRNKCL